MLVECLQAVFLYLAVKIEKILLGAIYGANTPLSLLLKFFVVVCFPWMLSSSMHFLVTAQSNFSKIATFFSNLCVCRLYFGRQKDSGSTGRGFETGCRLFFNFIWASGRIKGFRSFSSYPSIYFLLFVQETTESNFLQRKFWTGPNGFYHTRLLKPSESTSCGCKC